MSSLKKKKNSDRGVETLAVDGTLLGKDGEKPKEKVVFNVQEQD